MATLSINYEIPENGLKDGEATEELKNNASASFGKAIIDLLKEGHKISISQYQESIQDIESEEDLIVVDENGKQENTKKKIKTQMYNCTADIQVLRVYNKTTGKSRCTRICDIKVKPDENGKLRLQPINKSKHNLQGGE